jgi:hypothetical protein
MFQKVFVNEFYRLMGTYGRVLHYEIIYKVTR